MAMTWIFHDVNEAYSEIQIAKEHFTRWEETRNGRALVFQMPVLVTHTQPYRRVLFDAVRDANPFFHYMEAIWMLAGYNSVRFPAYFASNIRNYSDDGVVLHGAYGQRWRNTWGMDQIEMVCHILKHQPESRRAVINMWNPPMDLEVDSKDIPCNTQIMFRVKDTLLDMTVINRSNDLVWGMLGANFVHFSCLHEYICGVTSIPMGDFHQFSNNLHVYEGWEDKFEYVQSDWYVKNPSFPRWAFNPTNFDWVEAGEFVEDMGTGEYQCRILRDNARPMMDAWEEYKKDDLDKAIHICGRIHDYDWKVACRAWLERRAARRQENGGQRLSDRRQPL